MSVLAWLDETFSLRLVQTLLHFLWQGTAIAMVAFALDAIFRRQSAQNRYLLNVAALAAMAACLPLTFAVLNPPAMHEPSASQADLAMSDPATRTSPTHLESASDSLSETTIEMPSVHLTPMSYDGPGRGNTQVELNSTAILDESEAPASGLKPVAFESASEPPANRSWLAVVSPYVACGYLVCVVALIARLASGLWGGFRLRQSALAVQDGWLLATLSRQARRVGLRMAPAVAYCERISVPVVIGITRPLILLPSSLVSGLTPDQLESLLTHELAHLRRHDPLVNLLQRLVEAVTFFHPAVWYISHRIGVERENASDDMVLAAGWQRVHYADALVRMAELSLLLRAGNATPPATALAASGKSNSDFKRRVMRLLEADASNFRLTSGGWTVLMLCLATAVVASLMAQSLAQQAASENRPEATSDDQQGEQLGRRIEAFRLQDYLGADHALSDFADKEIVVVAFLGTECPLAKLYGPRLAALDEKYEPRGVAFLGINSNQQDTPTELRHYARRHGVSFPLLKDPGNRVADLFRAERTPEVFVLDKQRTVRYWGRIDDQFGVGFARPEPKQNYLAAAIDDLLASSTVKTPSAEPVGCHIGRVARVEPTGDITYTKQISRVIQDRCVECHREGGIAPFALDSYDAVAAWAETIREVVEDRRMPPWHASPEHGTFVNDGRMPEAERVLLYQWVANGVPEGDPRDLPPRREYVDGWALGQPDVVLRMSEPITVPPTGVVDYQYVTIDPGFAEGKWVRASEIRPGVRSVVHHIVVFIDPPGGDPILEERGIGFEMVGGYVPGSPPMELRDGVARFVPAGSKFVFQIHYTPDGTQRKDRSEIGLYFADPKYVRRTMQTGIAVNTDFRIPAHSASHRVEAAHRFSHEMELHSLTPHMHYRGKSFRFEVTYPNGSREILLDVPRYDFNWQDVYRFAEPKLMPEGTLLRCVAHFDNSDDNLSNPDPSVSVRWGEQSWEEMMIGYFEGVFLNQDLSLPEPQLTPTGDGKYRARFTYKPDRPIKTVNVAGTFNEWSTSSDPLLDPDGDGMFSTDVTLGPGDHRYKFVIDGDYWTHDPASRILTGFLHESFFVAGRDASSSNGE